MRYTIHGQRREMGLGSFRDVSLKEARHQASHWREVVRLGKDPIRERERLKREAAKPVMTLEMVAREAFEAKKTGLKADGKAGRWMSPIELHVLPKFGRIPIGEIDQTDVKRILSPIWRTKSDTARKVVSRLRYIIKYAAASKLEVDIQAVDLAVILLGETGHVSKNIPAMNWKDVPEFYQGLEDRAVSHLAVRFLILTGVRAKPVRHAKLTQINGNVWTIPGEDMKGKKGSTPDFRVPLSTEALKVIDAARCLERGGYLFPGLTRGVISDTAMTNLLRDQNLEARLHGFRSSLRTWIDDNTDARKEVAEMVLAHQNLTSVEKAYLRKDFLQERAPIMQKWSNYLIAAENS